MKNYILWFSTVLFLLPCLNLTGQSHDTFLHGFSYQAMLRDEAQQGQANKNFKLRINIIGSDSLGLSHYSELHDIQTNQDGLFELVVGQGKQRVGSILDLPWAKEQLWLQVEMAQNGASNYELVSNAPLNVVPYALHAANTTALYDPTVLVDEPIEKNSYQSIYWTTSGNLGTNPAVNFVGTRDNQNVVFKTNGKTFMTLSTMGKLSVLPEVPAGKDDNKLSYPVVVEGTDNIQGVWVRVKGLRSSANNFVTFASDGKIYGRIEGETLAELEKSDAYVTQAAVTTLNGVALTGKTIALVAKVVAEGIAGGLAIAICGVSLGTIACEDIAGSIVGMVANSLRIDITVTELASYLAATGTSFDRIRSKVGVAYKSGYDKGDYAEWMLRNPGEPDMVYGEIVGVNGGVVSRNTSAASHYMVVSQNPSFLGKVPAEGTEENYEKVAFMGQVAVRVFGKVNAGDYILPSGKNDGLGIAVAPNELPIYDYSKIVGKAWETIDNDLPFNLVNVGVGIRANDLADKVDEVEKKLDEVVKKLGGAEAIGIQDSKIDISASNSNPSLELSPIPSSSFFNQPIQKMSNAEFGKMMDSNSKMIKNLFARMEVRLKSEGRDLSHPAIVRLFKDPINTLKKMNDNPKEFIEWALAAR